MTILNVTIEPSSETDGSRDREPQESTTLSSQSPIEEWEEWEYEQIDQDHDGDTHWMKQLSRANGSPPTLAGQEKNSIKSIEPN